jgi:hypothetical protein
MRPIDWRTIMLGARVFTHKTGRKRLHSAVITGCAGRVRVRVQFDDDRGAWRRYAEVFHESEVAREIRAGTMSAIAEVRENAGNGPG